MSSDAVRIERADALDLLRLSGQSRQRADRVLSKERQP